MLLRALFARDTARPDTDLAFKSRGAEVSRLEGFSDAVFGFAITLLVISSKAPDSSADLLAMRHAVLPFVASFTILFVLWRAQFNFFRRYGLEDRRTTTLTGVLLMIVLLAVYPVKFLCTFALDVVPTAAFGGIDALKSVMPPEHVPKVLLTYALGLGGVGFVFSRLYRHAATQHAVIGLSELELFDTRVIERRCTGIAAGGAVLSAWCIMLIALWPEGARRPSAWIPAFYGVFPVILVFRFVRMRTMRRLAREREGLLAEGSRATAPRPVIIT